MDSSSSNYSTPVDVKHLAQLSALSVTDTEAKTIASQFSDTLKVVSQLEELSTTDIATTPQVTGRENVTRSDNIDQSRVLSQKEALSNAKKVHQGFFVVKAVI